MDRMKIEKGMFLTSGPPANGAHLTKVHTSRTVEETDEKFEEAERLQEILARTKKAIEALKTRPN